MCEKLLAAPRPKCWRKRSRQPGKGSQLTRTGLKPQQLTSSELSNDWKNTRKHFSAAILPPEILGQILFSGKDTSVAWEISAVRRSGGGDPHGAVVVPPAECCAGAARDPRGGGDH